MKLRTRFFLFAIAIHLIMMLMAAFILKYSTGLFLLSEALILVSIALSISLYRAFVKPLNIMAAGLESLKERDFSIKFVKIGQYEIDQLIEVYNKMIDQLREERIELHEQHYFLDKLLQASPSGILILDYEGKVNVANPSALKFFGLNFKTISENKLKDIDHSLARSIAEINSGESVTIKSTGNKTYKCHKGHFINKGYHQHFIIIEELTAEILKAEKVAYGKVIRMMSHEINNTVGAVNSMLNTVKKEKFTEDNDYGQILQVCIDRNQRMAKFMSNFAEVIRLPEPKKEMQDLYQLIEDVILLFKEKCHQHNINLDINLDGDEYLVCFDAAQMEQALINIIKNAIESIGNNGNIWISTAKNDNKLVIGDNGKGIDQKIKSNLFSPFFSTKKEGQGIGLTITKEILYKHNFMFSLETNRDGITEFIIRLGEG